jgi:predicted MFS family arabinose efflux permease
MWSIETRWFDVAVVMTIFGIGNVLFGRFEEHKPRARRLLKVVIVSAAFVGLASTAGRAWAYGVLAMPLAVALWVHVYWLPKHGISGWTAEPRDKYLELMRSRQKP